MSRELIKIMVEDDSPLILEIVSTFLREAGYDVIARSVAVGTGAAIIRERPALVLMDVSMPLVSGGEISASLQGNTATRDTVIVLHSDRPEEELALIAEQCGAQGYLRKSGDPRKLVGAIQHWLSPASSGVRRSGARTRPPSVLVAGDEKTRQILQGPLASRLLLTFTDSGTEALRLICAKAAPQTVLLGTSLVDLPFHVVWHKAVTLDAGWRKRIVALDERAPDAPMPPWPIGMARWTREEPLERLVETIERAVGA
jgi:CheY-like chemotaxis protein